MCGILAVVSPGAGAKSDRLISSTQIIRHRGPDDEGFLTWSPGESPRIWLGADSSLESKNHWQYPELPAGLSFTVGFGHRRLSIIDLSPQGHQPMSLPAAGLSITYNGEVYNYLEVKEALVQLGHQFHTTSDTEVILHAWQQWGADSLSRFNGMFAFVILDTVNNVLFAARDRFGVKPLYVSRLQGGHTILASEIKQIRAYPGYQFSLNEEVAVKFLEDGVTDATENTFDRDIQRIPPGCYAKISLDSGAYELRKWYQLGGARQSVSSSVAAAEFKALLADAVRLRLRSDVTVGSCLSGGLDSSSLVCLMADQLKNRNTGNALETVTACYEQSRYDEWNYASQVVDKAHALPHKVFPAFTQLVREVDDFLWYHDEPVGSTSVFSQWSVFKATNQAQLKVMIDGQGADEYLAGYGSNDLPLYAGLLSSFRLAALLDEILAYKKERHSWPVGFLLGALQLSLGPAFSKMLPARLRLKVTPPPAWLRAASKNNKADLPQNLKAHLKNQLFFQPLPALLRYEDRNSMAWSVESRTPFMDYRLVEYTMGLPDRFICKRGVRKVILRKAMKGVLPEAIENRKDKMGFVTPEELWLKGEGKDWFKTELNRSADLFPGLFEKQALLAHFEDMASGKISFDFSIWRVICLGRWYNLVTGNERNK